MGREYCTYCGCIGCEGCEPETTSTPCKYCGGAVEVLHEGNGETTFECAECGGEN